MEIFDEEDEEIRELMRRISLNEITLCNSCDTFFDYIPQRIFCDECNEAKKRKYARERYHRPEVKAKRREYERRPEVKAKRREYERRPEVKERRRKNYQRPEVKAKKRKYARERYHRLKQLREGE